MSLLQKLRNYYKHIKKPQVAEIYHRRLTLVYTFLAWNGLGIGLYLFLGNKKKVGVNVTSGGGEKESDDLSIGQQMAKQMGKENAKIIRFKGTEMTVIEPKEMKATSSEELIS